MYLYPALESGVMQLVNIYTHTYTHTQSCDPLHAYAHVKYRHFRWYSDVTVVFIPFNFQTVFEVVPAHLITKPFKCHNKKDRV
jgi:hypothetical protein